MEISAAVAINLQNLDIGLSFRQEKAIIRVVWAVVSKNFKYMLGKSVFKVGIY